jgi:hypothetical protein
MRNINWNVSKIGKRENIIRKSPMPLHEMKPEEVDKALSKLISTYHRSLLRTDDVWEALRYMDRIADKIRLKVERKRSNVEEGIKGFFSKY